MTYTRSILFIVTILFSGQNINAQSTLINALPLEYNPSFAGSAGVGRLASSLSKDLFIYREITGTISYDQFISKLSTGIGFTTGYFNAHENLPIYYIDISGQPKAVFLGLKKAFVGVSLAPKFSVKGKFSISPSLQTNFSEARGEITTIKYSRAIVNLRAGILLNSKKFFVGYTINILNTANANLLNYSFSSFRDYREEFPSNLQLGYTFQRRESSKFSFSPQAVIYFGRNNFRYTDVLGNYLINLNFKYKSILSGLTLGNGRSGVMVGYQKEKIKVMLAYYFLSVGLRSGQISFRYLLPSKKISGLPKNNY